MDCYDFELKRGDETIASLRSVALSSMAAAWPRIDEMTKNIDEPGCRIRVTDKFGRLVILVGVATARKSLATIPRPTQFSVDDRYLAQGSEGSLTPRTAAEAVGSRGPESYHLSKDSRGSFQPRAASSLF